MAFAFLQLATAAMRRFWPVAVRAVRENLSANRAIAAFKKAGDAIRRTDALATMRVARNIETLGKHLSSLKPNTRIRIFELAEAATKIRRNFGYTVKTTVIDHIGDETFTRFVTVSSDTLLTPKEINEFASKVAEDSSYGEELETLNATLISGVKSVNL